LTARAGHQCQASIANICTSKAAGPKCYPKVGDKELERSQETERSECCAFGERKQKDGYKLEPDTIKIRGCPEENRLIDCVHLSADGCREWVSERKSDDRRAAEKYLGKLPIAGARKKK
jgi:hypothetical protein